MTRPQSEYRAAGEESRRADSAAAHARLPKESS